MFTTKNLLLLVGRHAAIALGTVVLSLVVVSFFAREIERISSTITKNRQLAVTLEGRAELFSTLKRDADIVGTGDTSIDHAFLPADNIADFISVLDSLGLKNSTVQTVNFSDPAPSTITAPFPVSMIVYNNTLGSTLATLSSYLKDFENLPYFTKIENLTISAQDKTGWRGPITVSFRATLYTKTVQ